MLDVARQITDFWKEYHNITVVQDLDKIYYYAVSYTHLTLPTTPYV